MSFKVWMKTGNILSYKSRCCASAWDLYDNYHATSDSGHLHKTWVCSTASLNWLNILFETSHVYLVVEIEIAVDLLSRAVSNSINITKVINIGTNAAPRCIDRFVVNDLQSPKWNETEMHFTIITYVDFFLHLYVYIQIFSFQLPHKYFDSPTLESMALERWNHRRAERQREANLNCNKSL